MNTAVPLITHGIGVVEDVCEQLASIPTRAKRGLRLDAISETVTTAIVASAASPRR